MSSNPTHHIPPTHPPTHSHNTVPANMTSRTISNNNTTTTPPPQRPLNLITNNRSQPAFNRGPSGKGPHQCPFPDCTESSNNLPGLFKHITETHNNHPQHASLTTTLSRYYCSGCNGWYQRKGNHLCRTTHTTHTTSSTGDSPHNNDAENQVEYGRGIQQLLLVAQSYPSSEFIPNLQSVHVVREVARSNRGAVGLFMNEVATLALSADSDELRDAFFKLICFIPAILIPAGTKAKQVKQRLDQIRKGNALNLIPEALEMAQRQRERQATRRTPTEDERPQLASKMIRANELRRAGRALNGSLAIAPATPTNVQKWRDLHPVGDALTDQDEEALQSLLEPWQHRGAEGDGNSQPRAALPPRDTLRETYVNRYERCTGQQRQCARIADTHLQSLPLLTCIWDPQCVSVAQACRRLNTKTHAGPFGLSVSLMKAAVYAEKRTDSESGDQTKVASPFACWVTQWGEGKVPGWFDEHVFRCSAGLIFQKDPPSTSIRPTGVGFGGRRAYTKHMLDQHMDAIRGATPSCQYGLDTKGTETIVHMVRDLLCQSDPHSDVVTSAPCHFQADETNAFNNCDRGIALRLARIHWPEPLYKYVERLYATPNKIVLGEEVLWAERGSTQGCGLGGALYNLTTALPLTKAQEAISQFNSALRHTSPCNCGAAAGYYDDCSTTATIAPAYLAMSTYIAESTKSAKRFNSSKCKFYTPSYALYQALSEASEQGYIMAHQTRIPLTRTGSDIFLVVQDVKFRIVPTDGIVVLGTPLGTPSFVKDVLAQRWSEEEMLLDRIGRMPDSQSGLWAIRLLAVSKIMYTLRTVPPNLTHEYTSKWDEKLHTVMETLMQSEPLTPLAKKLLAIKPVDGGCGVPNVTSLSPIAYASSLAGVTWRLRMTTKTFADAAQSVLSLPPIQNHNREESITLARDAEAELQAELIEKEVYCMTPRLAVAKVWAILHRLPEQEQKRVLETDPGQGDDITVESLAAVSLKAKLQRELALQCSREDRTDLTTVCYDTLSALHSDDRRDTAEWREAVQDRIHISPECQWKLLHSLTPWIPCFNLPHAAYAAALRYQLRLKRSELARLPSYLFCDCANRQAHPRRYALPSYHAFTCGFGAAIRKLAHNKIVTLTTALISQCGRYSAVEPINPEASGNGIVPDIFLGPGLRPPRPQEGVTTPTSVDVTLTSLAQARNYKLVPNGVASAVKINRVARYNSKRTKHGPGCAPVVFDFSGSLHAASLAFLEQATSGHPGKLAFFRRHAAAIIYRMVAQLDERNYRQLMKSQSPSEVAADQAAYELWMDEGEALGYDRFDVAESTTTTLHSSLPPPPPLATAESSP